MTQVKHTHAIVHAAGGFYSDASAFIKVQFSHFIILNGKLDLQSGAHNKAHKYK